MTKNLSQVLSPTQHQRMIERLSAKFNSALSAKHNNEIARKIEWHAEQYANKTGQLPK